MTIDPARDRKLRQWLAACRDEPLGPRDLRHVDLERVRGESRMDRLLDVIDLAPEGETTCQLFTGFRGTGKSTELRHLQLRLEDAGFVVLLADAKVYHTLTRDLLIDELLPILAGAFGESAQHEFPKDFFKWSWWDRLKDFLGKEVKLDARISLSGVELKPALHGDEAFLTELRRALTGRLDALATKVHEFIEEVTAALVARRPEARGVVFIFDNLEKLSGPESLFVDRMRSVLEVFTEHQRHLRVPSCHTIYAVPLYLQILYPSLSELYDGAIEVLPTVKVHERAPHRPPHEQGLEALRSLLAKRIPLDEAFADQLAIDRLILASGGHLRGLLDLVTDALTRARRVGLPVDATTVDASIARFSEKRRDAVRADAAPMLDMVRQRFSYDHVTTADLPRFAHYLDNHLVLCYRNGDGWYDVHPAIRDHVAQLAAAVGASTDAA